MSYDNVSKTLSIAWRELDEIPSNLVAKYKNHALILDLQRNYIRKADVLREFEKMHTLILDYNDLDSIAFLPVLPGLTTLWLNNNKFTDLEGLLTNVRQKCPRLLHLSMMRNPACPGFNDIGGKEDDGSNQRYRLFTIYKLDRGKAGRLLSLDGIKVKPEEIEAAAKRGKFCAVRKPVAVTEAHAAAAAGAGSALRAARTDRLRSNTASSSYISRSAAAPAAESSSSEGNRFIGNDDL